MYEYRTTSGVFQILSHKTWWYAVYNGEGLGQFRTPELAAIGLSRGQTFTPSNGVRPEKLAIPSDLTQWSVAEKSSSGA